MSPLVTVTVPSFEVAEQTVARSAYSARVSCGTVALCQPPWRGQSWVTHWLLPGTALSQTTPTPTVMSTALIENVTTLTVTPVILSSTTPGCATFNISTCEPCAPGSRYDNSESPVHPAAHLAMFGLIQLIKKAGTVLKYTFLSLPQTLSSVHAAPTQGCVYFLGPACHVTKASISHSLGSSSVGLATAATTQSELLQYITWKSQLC